MIDVTGPSSTAFSRLADWYRAPLGRALGIQERDCLERLLRETFGYYLVQIGLIDPFREALTASRIRHHVLVVPGGAPSDATGASGDCRLLARPDALPFAADSIDAVLLTHALDLAADPRALLREVERVLIPDGRVILVGFNALSAWGAWRLARRAGGPAPWCARFHNPYRLADWLNELGFTIEQRESLMYRPPLRGAMGPRGVFFDTLGQQLWPLLGAIHGIRAVKRVATLTPLPTARRARRALLPSRVVEPSVREGGHV